MRQEVRSRIKMLRDLIAAEVTPSRADRRAWMSLRPVEDGRILLLEFEIDSKADTDSYLGPDDIFATRRTYFDTLAEAEASLVARQVDTTMFDAPWKVDYPL